MELQTNDNSDVIVMSQRSHVPTTWRHDVTVSRWTMTSHHDVTGCCRRKLPVSDNSFSRHCLSCDRATIGIQSTGMRHLYRCQCDFRFDLFFSFSFSFSFASYLCVCKSYTASTPNIKPADEDVLMICLNTVHH